jgi:repressor LexA
MKPLTNNQKKILSYIERSFAKNICPSQHEMADHFGVTQNAICQYINSLKLKGYLEGYSPHRGLRFTKEYEAAQEKGTGLPLIGRIAAGVPILAEENITDYIDVGNIIKKPHKDAFILQIVGDSMIEDNINDGEIVKPQRTIENGQIGVALIEDEATVKRIYFKAEKLILKPSNPKYKETVYTRDDENVRIAGIVIGSFRRF